MQEGDSMGLESRGKKYIENCVVSRLILFFLSMVAKSTLSQLCGDFVPQDHMDLV